MFSSAAAVFAVIVLFFTIIFLCGVVAQIWENEQRKKENK